MTARTVVTVVDESNVHDGYVPPPEESPEDAAGGTDNSHEALRRFVPGGSFILDQPTGIPAIWGSGNAVLWAEGEALMLCGPSGVGKTTIGGQLVRARIAGGDVLGHAVRQTGTRVLYLAMDRPRQIARALRRHLGDIDRDTLDRRLVVWPGPPMADLAKHPEMLVGLAQLAGADTVVVDSLKDAAIGLSDDEVGAGYNCARQMCLSEGIELLELHHLVKRGPGGAAPKTLADVYGSGWLTAGTGSVVLLWGDAGDPIVELRHLKQPADEVGPFKVMHDPDAGTSSVWHSTDLALLAKQPGGITARDAARAMFDTDKPSESQKQKARRRLNALARAGVVVCEDGDEATHKPAVWTHTGSHTDRLPVEPPYGPTEPIRKGQEPQVNSHTGGHTGHTDRKPYARPPSYIGGDGVAVACATGSDAQIGTCTSCGSRTYDGTCAAKRTAACD